MKRAGKSKLNMSLLGGAAVGGIAVGMVANKVLPSVGLPDQIVPFVPIGLGIFLAMQRNPLMQAVGVGMIGASAPKALEAVGIEIGNPLGLMPGYNYSVNGPNYPVVIQGPGNASLPSEPVVFN